MPPDDGHMTETYCGSNIERGKEELLCWRIHNCFVNYSDIFLGGVPFCIGETFSPYAADFRDAPVSLADGPDLHCDNSDFAAIGITCRPGVG
jgi:hypothetical protein